MTTSLPRFTRFVVTAEALPGLNATIPAFCAQESKPF